MCVGVSDMCSYVYMYMYMLVSVYAQLRCGLNRSLVPLSLSFHGIYDGVKQSFFHQTSLLVVCVWCGYACVCVCVCGCGCRTADRSKDGVSYSAGVSVEDEGDVVVVKTAANGEDEGRGGRK